MVDLKSSEFMAKVTLLIKQTLALVIFCTTLYIAQDPLQMEMSWVFFQDKELCMV